MSKEIKFITLALVFLASFIRICGAGVFDSSKCYFENNKNAIFCEDKHNIKNHEGFDKIEFNMDAEKVFLHNTLEEKSILVDSYNISPKKLLWSDWQHFIQMLSNSWIQIKIIKANNNSEIKLNIHSKMLGGMWSSHRCSEFGCPGHSSSFDRCYRFSTSSHKCGSAGCPGHSSSFDRCHNSYDDKVYKCGESFCSGHKFSSDKCFTLTNSKSPSGQSQTLYKCGNLDCKGHISSSDKCYPF